jgi:hypothetical protein
MSRHITLYQIRDITADMVVGPIMAMYHPAQAVRQFTDLVKDPTTLIGKHPEDYELIELGRQDENTGTLDAFNTPVRILDGATLLAVQQREQPALAL